MPMGGERSWPRSPVLLPIFAVFAQECDEDQQWSPSVGRCEPCPPHSDTDGKRQTKGEGGKTLCGCSKGYFGYSPTHADGHGACEQCPEGKFRSTWGPACQDCSLSPSAVASLRDRDCVDNVGRGSETDYTDDQFCARLCAGEDDCVDELTDDTDCGSLCQREAINPRMCCPDPKVQDECTDCPTGSTAAPDRTYCICPADRYWDSDEGTCVSCPENAGTDGATGKMSIADCKCNEGYGRDRDPDVFHDNGCQLCLTPSISLETSWGRVCGCRDGYYEDPDSPEDGCKSCGWGPGTDVTQWDPQCNCRPGYKRDATGACVKCPRNMFRSCVTSTGPHERDLCQNENDDSGEEVCISCDTVADFSITDGTAKASSKDCICPPNSEMGAADEGHCPPDCGPKHLPKCTCAVGYVQNDITGRCAACPQDSYRDGADGKCTSCATHDSNMVTNASIALSPDACLCKAGWWGGWNPDGSALCEQCDVDSYKGRDANDLHCSACPKAASTYGLTARTDITDCLCEPGYRRDPQAAYHDDVPLCAPCPEGTFSASRDSTSCTACPDNSGAAVATQASCDCAEGYETADGSSKTTGDACVKAAPHPIELDKLPSVYYNVAIATMVVLFCCVAAMYHRARRAADNANAAAMQLLLGSPAEMKLGASSEGRRTVFASMRFPDGQPLPHAIKLQAALKKTGVDMTIIRLDGVADITKEVFQGIEEAGAFIAFGTKSYAEDTGNPACSYYELKHAQASNKPIILIREGRCSFRSQHSHN